jgi:hypothetical protein
MTKLPNETLYPLIHALGFGFGGISILFFLSGFVLDYFRMKRRKKNE